MANQQKPTRQEGTGGAPTVNYSKKPKNFKGSAPIKPAKAAPAPKAKGRS